MRHAILALGLLASAGRTQSPPPAADDAIVVQGRNGAVLRSYVDKVAKPTPGHQLARWNVPLCVRYDGLADRFSAFIQARVAATAQSVGLPVAGPSCPTAVLVKLTDQADALAKALVHMHPPQVGSLTTRALLPKRDVDALEAPHTVRWLTASATVNRDGTPIMDAANKLWIDSMIQSPTREDLASKIVLIDAQRLAGVTLDQLADYLSFVILASPDVAADFSGADSIMALFADGGGPRPAGLTNQDRAFLDALYRTPAARTAREQKSAIHARLSEDERLKARD